MKLFARRESSQKYYASGDKPSIECSKEVFCDVTLVSDDFQLFPAHKLVLAAHSPVLERLLLSLARTNDNTVLHMRGYTGVCIQRMLSFMYCREAVEDKDSNLDNLVVDLKITGLMKDVPATNISVSPPKKSQQAMDGIISNHTVLKHKSISLNVITENKEEEIRMETRGVQKGVNPSGMEGVLDLILSDHIIVAKLIEDPVYKEYLNHLSGLTLSTTGLVYLIDI